MFCVGHRTAHIVMGMDSGILVIRIFGDTLAHDIKTAMRIAHSLGWLQPHSRSLVDIRRFSGSIDWRMLRDLTELTPWSRDRSSQSSHCAYLFGDRLRDWFLSIVAGIYPGAGHRKFEEEAKAMAWLHEIGMQQTTTKLAIGGDSG